MSIVQDLGCPLQLRGIGASPGTVVGPVQIITAFREFEGDFPEGAILVSRTTDPRFILHMTRARGIVTEIGGRLCHTAIVALELGIPCVVAVAGACSLLTNGMYIQVDGQTGAVSEMRISR